MVHERKFRKIVLAPLAMLVALAILVKMVPSNGIKEGHYDDLSNDAWRIAKWFLGIYTHKD